MLNSETRLRPFPQVKDFATNVRKKRYHKHFKELDATGRTQSGKSAGTGQENHHSGIASRGAFCSKKATANKRTIYVLTGEVELRTDTKVVRVITGGTNEAKHPLAPMLPRKVNARARTDIEFISIDSDLLDVMLTWDQTGSYEVNELAAPIRPTAMTG